MCTAEQFAAAFRAMPDDLASAMLANGRQLMNCAFKAVENMPVTRRGHLKAQSIVVTAHFTLCHGNETDSAAVLHALTVMNSRRLYVTFATGGNQRLARTDRTRIPLQWELEDSNSR